MDLVIIVNLGIKLFYSYTVCFLYCEIGEDLRSRFDELADAMHRCDFIVLPIEIQRIIPTIIMSLQLPPILQGFGNIQLTRHTFKYVRNIDTL